MKDAVIDTAMLAGCITIFEVYAGLGPAVIFASVAVASTLYFIERVRK